MQRSMSSAALLVLSFAITSTLSCEGEKPDPADFMSSVRGAVTLPFVLDHNRIIVELQLRAADGTVAEGRAWVDTGTEVLIVAESLARTLGLNTSALTDRENGGSVEVDAAAPTVLYGDLVLDTAGVPLRIYPGDSTGAGLAAEIHLPAAVLRSHHVVFDYQGRRLTVALPGTLQPQGAPVACQVNPETGLLKVNATIDGETVALGVDTGSAGTWVSRELTERWQRRHTQWPVATGAAGSTNFFGRRFELDGTLMRLPAMEIGTVAIHDLAVLGLNPGLFNWYSQKSAGSVSGFIGGNVLRRIRLEVDWPSETTYWQLGNDTDDRDLDIVGLTLQPKRDGTFWVSGVVEKVGGPRATGVQVGDRLIRVGELEVTGATMGTVVEALRGEPGSQRSLLVERDGRQIEVKAPVEHLP